MLEYYHRDCKQHDPDGLPYQQQFVSFMINHHFDKMKTLMLRARCAQNEVYRAYQFYRQGPPGHDRTPIVQPQAVEEDDDVQSTGGYSSRISLTKSVRTRLTYQGTRKTSQQRTITVLHQR
eukprot:6270749-Amphidinium_carterae.1